jgi:long-chain acyl-CoA synthetase
MADAAVLLAGGVSAAAYPSLSGERLAALARHIGASVLFVEDEEQLDKALAIKAANPAVTTIVVMAPEAPIVGDGTVVPLEELGAGDGAAAEAELAARIAAAAPDDIAVLVFTSGSTGQPRAVPLSNHNVCSALALRFEALPARADEEQLSLLPLALAAERIQGLYAALATGTLLHFPEGADTAFDNLRELAPTSVFAIPRVWERFYSNVTLALAAATPLQRLAYRAAIGIGYRAADRRAGGQAVSPALALAEQAARRLVLNGVRKAIGLGRARWLMTGGAPLADELTRWYGALGLPVLQLYGQAETAATVALTPLGAPRPGTVGRVLPGLDVRTNTAGEVLVRGAAAFGGYLGDPQESARALTDGWFHTGDIGELGADGYLRIVDRVTNIVVTAAGARVMPSEIENRLNLSPYIADAVVVGEGRRNLACLILIDYDHVVRFAQDNGVPFTNFQSLSRAPAVSELIGREIDRLTAATSGSRIERFGLIDVELMPGDEELTPAIKLRRSLVQERFKSLVEAMYREAA